MAIRTKAYKRSNIQRVSDYKKLLRSVRQNLNQRNRKKYGKKYPSKQKKLKINRKFENVAPQATGMSFSRCVVKYPQMKGFTGALKMAPTDIYRISDRFYYTSLVGEQGAHNLYHYVANGVVPAHTGVLTVQHIQTLIARMVRTSGDAESTFGSKIGASLQRIWLNKMTVNTMYTNQGPGTMVMYIYDCIANSAKATLPRTDWDIGIDQAEGNSAWQDVSSGANFGSRPQENEYFNKMWKVKKVSRIELHTGGSHQHNFSFSYNGLLPIEEVGDRPITNNAIKGVTCNQLLIIHGTPVDNTNAFALNTGSSEVSIDQTKVVGTTTCTVYTKMLSSKAKKIYSTNQLPDSAALVAAFVQSEKDQAIVNSFITTNFA